MRKVLVVGYFPANSLTDHQVQITRDYDEAIEILKTRNFDVIIMDAVIDSTVGHTFIMHVRHNGATPTIVWYEHPDVYMPGVNKTWKIIPSVATWFTFAACIQKGDANAVNAFIQQLDNLTADVA